ncbi:MAG TPA: peptide chain release factor N(5)-glutamine methyltransferase [Solirubrobacteraceae bacterium]|nr:peptide chain release factor N(5)-glutamine methyltransferase [Solirubrobacteraceae bacterium]
MPASLRATSIHDALESAAGALGAGGCDTPRLDAEVLLAHVLGTDRAALLRDADRPVEGAAIRAYQDAVRRRAIEREPVAYITGRRAFRYLELEVDRRVLIPRPETELLVEVGLELAPGARVLDVGTGSGAVALALKHERPDLLVAGSDHNPEALAVARANAARLGLDAAWIEADLLDGLPAPAPAFDAVLSNPPYVSEAEHRGLAPEITRHEPDGALVAAEEGLAVIRRLVEQAARLRIPLLAVEVGLGQAPAVAALMRAHGHVEVATRSDLAGIERVVMGRMGSAPQGGFAG